MRVWVVACLMASLALAGCFGGNDDNNEPQDDPCPDDGQMENQDGMDGMDQSMEEQGGEASNESESAAVRLLALRQTNETGNETGEEPGPEAQSGEPTDDEPSDHMLHECPDDEEPIGFQPGASVTADPTTGTVPFNVTFFLEVFEVPLDENLTWTLDVDGDLEPETKGNGNNLPGNYTRTYTFAGTYNVTFSATDGTDTWNATTQIVAEEGEEEPPEEPGEPVPESEPFPGIYEEIFVAATCGPACTFGGAATVCAGLAAHQNGVDCAYIEIPKEAWGKKFTINSDWVEEDPDGAALASCDGGATEIDSYGPGGGEAGTIPPGTGCLVGWEFTGPASTIIFFVEGDL